MRIKKRILAGAMALACALSSLSLTALAEEVNAVAQPTLHYDFTTGETAMQNKGTAEVDDAELYDGATLTDTGVDLSGEGRQAVKVTGKSWKNGINSSTAITLSMTVKADKEDGNRTLISYGRGEQHRLVVVHKFNDRASAPRWSSDYKENADATHRGEANFEPKNGEEYGKILENKWMNVTFVQDGKNLTLYVNGDLIQSVSDFRDTLSEIASVADAEDFYGLLGAPKDNIYAGDQRFDGKISDFRIYDQALSADQVKGIYDETLASVNYGSLSGDKLEAENFTYNNRDEVAEGKPKTENGDSYKAVANTKNGLTLTYKGVTFADGVNTVSAHIKGGLDKVRSNTTVKYYIDSVADENLFATMEPYSLFTQNGWSWIDATATINKDISGTHDLIVVMNGTEGSGSYMGNYDYFTFTQKLAKGLNATYYQTEGQKSNDGWVYGDIIKKATGFENNYNNAPGGDVEEKNRLFDGSIQAMLDASKELGTATSTDFVANIKNWGDFRNTLNLAHNDSLVVYEGTMTVPEGADGTYTFDGKIDNGAAIFIDGTKVFEFWGNRSWADRDFVNGSSMELTAGEHNVKIYYIKLGGGQGADIRAAKDNGDKTAIADLFTFNMNVKGYGVYGLTGDYGKLNNAINAGTKGNTGVLEGNQNYDASIAAVKNSVVKVGEQVIPGISIGGNTQFRTYAEKVGCSGNDAIVVDYNGYITPMVTGDYTFGFEKIDNGLVMEIDDNNDGVYTRVAEYWAASTWYDNNSAGILYDDAKGTIHLEAGKSYPFKASFLELDGGEVCLVRAKTADGAVADARIDDAFVFTTMPYYGTSFDKGIPTLGAADSALSELAYFNFSKDGLPTAEDEKVNAVENLERDATTGAAVFNGKSGNDSAMIELADSITAELKKSSKVVMETVIKGYASPGHGVVASVGVAGDKIALAGLREGWKVKTQKTESTSNALPYAQWTKVKWVFSKYTGVQIYADDVLVAENANEKQALADLEGTLRIGRNSNPKWVDPSLDGLMSEFRLSVDYTQYAQADEKGIVATFPVSGFANGKTWDRNVQKTTDENGNFVMPSGNAGNFWGAYWNEIRPNEYYKLKQGTYKIVYLFDFKENSGRDMLLKVFQKNGDTEFRTNENFERYYWNRYAAGNKVALSFVLDTTRDLDGFEIGGWKGGDISGTMDGLYICSADCDVAAAFPEYNVLREGKPIYYNGGATKAAEDGSWKESTFTIDEKADTLKGVKYLDNASATQNVLANINFSDVDNATEGVVVDNATVENGVAMFDSKGKVTFPDAVTEAFKEDGKQVVLEMALRSMRSANHTALMTLGTADSKKPYIVTGYRDNGQGYKINSAFTENGTLAFDNWATVKYIIRRSTTSIYVNNKLLGTYDAAIDLSNISGILTFGQQTVGGWSDAGFYGAVSQLRVSTEDERALSNNTNITEVKVDGTVATLDGDKYTVKVAKADKHNVVVTTEDANAGYEVSADLNKITVYAEDGTVKEYALEVLELNEKTTRVEAESVAPDHSGAATNSSTYGVNWGCGTDDTQLKIENGGTGKQIAGTKNGDWFKYTVDCGDALTKIAVTYTGNKNSANVRLLVKLGDKDGEQIAEINCPATGSWSNYVSAATTKFTKALSGKQTLCFVIDRVADSEDSSNKWHGNYDFFEFTTLRAQSSDATLASVTVDGVAATIDGTNVSVKVDPADAHVVVATPTSDKAAAVVSEDQTKITVTAEDGTVIEYTLNIKEKPVYPSEPKVVDSIEVGMDWPTGNGDYLYDKSFTNLAPGVYKLAYYVSGASYTENDWQMRISPRVKGEGVGERRCWVDFRYKSYIGASMDANGLSDKIIIVAVINVPEGYDRIDAGAFIEARFNGRLDKISLATGDYDFINDTEYEWCVERANTNDFNEDNGGLLKVADDAWTPSTRISKDASLASVTVNGVAATIKGDKVTVAVDKSDSYKVEYTAVAGATAVFENDTFTVTAQDGVTKKTYTLEIVELVKSAATPYADAITVDGEKDAAYGDAYEVRRTYDRYVGASDNKAKFYTAWKGDRLYFYVDVDDSTIVADNPDNLGQNDRVVLYFDFANTKADTKYKETDGAMGAAIKFALQKAEDGSYFAAICSPDNDQTDLDQTAFQASAESAVKLKDDGSGYVMEVSVVPSDLYKDLKLEGGKDIGFELVINDVQQSGNGRAAVVTWVDTADRAWEYSNALGELVLGNAPSSDATIASVTVDGVAAKIDGTNITVEVAKAASHTVEVTLNDAKATWAISEDGKTITVTAEDGTQVTYTLTISEKAPAINNPTNGVTTVNGKTILFKDGKQVTGTTVVTVAGKTYAVVGGYVATGKTTRILVIGGKSYVVGKNGVVVTAKANKLVKIGKKSYIINKYGMIIKGAKNKLVKVGKKSYIVGKSGAVVKGAKNKLVKVGKKSYIVNKNGVVQKNKKSIKVGKKTYKTNKKGIAKRK